MGRHDMFVSGYDRIYFTNPVLVNRLKAIYGLPVGYLPEACNSTWHVPLVEFGTEPVVVMAGNVHPTRAALLARLVGDGIPLRLYGARIPDWVGHPQLRSLHTGEYIARARKAEVFRSARVVLNNLHPSEFGGTNCRIFEATGSGGAECGRAYVRVAPGAHVR
jgi:spore maturation protein CgeB